MIAHVNSRFLDLPALAALENLRFTTRRRIDGALSGRHRSRQLGGAGEFVDFREYTPGDDLRRLDWKVFARTGRSYVRLHQDETNLTCTFLLDASGSMRFGEAQPGQGRGSKLEYAQYLATALSYLIVGGQDRVGLAVAAERLREFVPPGSTPEHLAYLLGRIESLETAPETNLGHALRQLFERQQRRGVLLFVSDFLCPNLEDVFAAVRLFRSRQWEVIALHLVHPDEERLPAGTAFRFAGLENEGHINCSPAEIRGAYEARFEQHCSSVRSIALATGCDYRRIRTSTHYLETLSEFLVERTG